MPPCCRSIGRAGQLRRVIKVEELRQRELLVEVGLPRQPAARDRERQPRGVARAPVAHLADAEVERHGALAHLQRADRVQHQRAGIGGRVERAQRDQQGLPGGQQRRSRTGPWRAPPSSSGTTSIGSSAGRLGSPQVMSKSAEISKKSSEIEPVPRARHGVGPSSAKSSRMLNTPAPKAFSETEAEISTMK